MPQGGYGLGRAGNLFAAGGAVDHLIIRPLRGAGGRDFILPNRRSGGVNMRRLIRLIKHGDTRTADMTGDRFIGNGKAVARYLVGIGSDGHHRTVVVDRNVNIAALCDNHRAAGAQNRIISARAENLFILTDHRVMKPVDLRDLFGGKMGAALLTVINRLVRRLGRSGEIEGLRIRARRKERVRLVDNRLIERFCPAAVGRLVCIGIMAFRPVNDLAGVYAAFDPVAGALVGRAVSDSRHQSGAVYAVRNADILCVFVDPRGVLGGGGAVRRITEDLAVLIHVDLRHF